MTGPPAYVHGYGDEESVRLDAQADSIRDLVHADTRFPAGSRVLEVGCGTGAQTVTLARNSPNATFVSFDRSVASLAIARERVASAGCSNVTFLHADLFALPFEPRSFDHVFSCFILEHVSDPMRALLSMKRMLRPAGSITEFEGDHGSTFHYPDGAHARAVVAAQVELQRRAGGDALIGRRLYPLLVGADFEREGHAEERVRGRQPAAAGPAIHAGDVHGHDAGRARRRAGRGTA